MSCYQASKASIIETKVRNELYFTTNDNKNNKKKKKKDFKLPKTKEFK